MHSEVIMSGILGLAVGDALGVPVEFKSRKELHETPITEMIGHGTHNQPAGTWSDDTSLTLATLDALARGLDYNEIMKNFCDWYYTDKYTATGVVFDVGNTIADAIRHFKEYKDIRKCGRRGSGNNGNGSLMRILPISLYQFYNSYLEGDSMEDVFRPIHIVSGLTHAHIYSLIGCGIYTRLVFNILLDKDKESLSRIVEGSIKDAFDFYRGKDESIDLALLKYQDLLNLRTTKETSIRSGGYIIDTLQASLWCLINTNNYKDCVLKAVNLGDDTDTTGAVVGSLAGLYYGVDSIPEEWLSRLQKLDYIKDLCVAFSNSTKDN